MAEVEQVIARAIGCVEDMNAATTHFHCWSYGCPQTCWGQYLAPKVLDAIRAYLHDCDWSERWGRLNEIAHGERTALSEAEVS